MFLCGRLNPLYSCNCRYSLNMQDILSRDRQSSSCESKCLSESTLLQMLHLTSYKEWEITVKIRNNIILRYFV